METNVDMLEIEGMKLPYEPGAFKRYGTIAGLTKSHTGSPGSNPPIDFVNDAGGDTVADPAEFSGPNSDHHDGDTLTPRDGISDGIDP